MNTPTDWVTAVAILAAGLVLGSLIFYAFSRRKGTIASDVTYKDLVAKRDALVQQLRELPPDATDERTRLELETASVLRALDGYSASPDAQSASALSRSRERGAAQQPGEGRMSPALQGVLWGAGSFCGLALLAFFVWQQSKPRTEGAPMTGADPNEQQQQQQQQADPVVLQLEAQVKANPENLELRNTLAQAYLERDNLMGVFEQTKYVLDRKPDDSRALTFNALVRMAMGDIPTSRQMLTKATQSDPQNMDGWVALAWISAQEGKMDDAAQTIAQAKKVSPANASRLDQILEQMKAQVGQAAAASQLPADHPPLDGAAPAPAPPAGGKSIKLTLQLDPAATTRQGVVFVIARNPSGGPPVAVRRLDASQLPITIDFGQADSMMGQPLPDTFRLEARLDTDGDAASRNPADPKAALDSVSAGATVTLALR